MTDYMDALAQRGESKITREIVDTLFSDEDDKILKTSRFSSEELEWVRNLEIHHAFFIQDFCYRVNINGREVDVSHKIRTVLNKFYHMSGAKDGMAFDKLLDALKTEQTINQINEKESKQVI